MTHVEIYGLWEEYYPNVDGFIEALQDQNVVIPKGESRHPYADVLHEWIEGAEIEASNLFGIEGFSYYSTAKDLMHHEYRIKPSEPVYEWQFEMPINGIAMETSNWYTDEEADDVLGCKIGSGYRKIEETKRVRK